MNNAHHPAHDAAFTFGEPMGHLTSLCAKVPLDVVQFAFIREQWRHLVRTTVGQVQRKRDEAIKLPDPDNWPDGDRHARR
jgi:hypothetical protein